MLVPTDKNKSHKEDAELTFGKPTIGRAGFPGSSFAHVMSASRIDESRHFFLAHDRGNMLGSFRIGGLGYAPAPLESLGIEEPKSCKIYRNGAWLPASFF